MATRHSNDAIARTAPIEGMPGPRWNRSKGIYPTSLRTYLECPRRCRLQYIDNIRFEQPWNRAIEVGNALHEVMERTANTIHADQEPPPVPFLRNLVASLLPESEYDDPAERIEDIDKVLAWAERGTRYITHGNPTILRVERHYPRHWNDPGELGKVMIGAKADLVILRRGKAGRYVEIIDYKSGYSRRWSQFTPILSSIALKRRIQGALPEQREPRTQFSYLWFAHEQRERIDLTPERKNRDWDELKQILIRLVHEEEWPMRPGPRTCKYCPYFNTECFPNAQMAAFTALDAASERG